MWRCVHCGRNDFRLERYLMQHLQHEPCRSAHYGDLSHEMYVSPLARRGPAPAENDEDPQLEPPPPPMKEAQEALEDVHLHDEDPVAFQLQAYLNETGAHSNDEDDEDEEDDDETHWYDHEDPLHDPEEEDQDAIILGVGSDWEDAGPLNDSGDESTSDGVDTKNGPETWIRDQFKEFVESTRPMYRPFRDEEVTAIRLMHLLRKKKTPLNAYHELLVWHLKEGGELQDGDDIRNCDGYLGRHSLLKALEIRYNLCEHVHKPQIHKVKLPISGTVVNLTCNDARSVIQQLLTDPRVTDEDYLFFDDNPLAGPPENITHVQELNTGEAFRDTHNQLIAEEGQQLLPMLIYMDGAAISQFHDMELIQVKISLGLHNRKYRMKSHAWGVLGYVEKIHEQGAHLG